MKLNDKIAALRKQRGMTQEELAEQLRVSRQSVSRWEIGSAQPDASNLFQLSRLFGVSADDLLNDERELPSPPGPEAPAMKKAQKILGLCAAAAGALGNLAIYIASRFVEVMVPWITYDEAGQAWYHWNAGHVGRSYKYFVQEYHLEGLAVLLWSLTAAGLLLAFINRKKLQAALRLKERPARKQER